MTVEIICFTVSASGGGWKLDQCVHSHMWLSCICIGRILPNVLLLQTLLDDVKGDTHGQFEDILVALVTPPAAYDCHEVMRAMKVLPAVPLDSP